MKKNVLWMLAAILTCGLAVSMSSCTSNDDNGATPVGDKSCAKATVEFRMSTTSETLNSFNISYVYRNDGAEELEGQLIGPLKMMGTAINSAWEVTTFPTKQQFIVDYKPKSDKTGLYELKREGEVVITTYDAKENVIDTKKLDLTAQSFGDVSVEFMRHDAEFYYINVAVAISEAGAITLNEKAYDEAPVEATVTYGLQTSAVTMNTFEVKHAWGDKDNITGPVKLMSAGASGAWITTKFPSTQQYIVNYTVKDSYTGGDYELLRNGKMDVITRDANGFINRVESYDFSGSSFGSDAENAALSADTWSMALNCELAADGGITFKED